jgi:stress response protein YsnF
MAQTVVGFFDDAAEAQRAVEQLVSNGFDRSRIDVSSGNNRGALSTSSTSSDPDNIHDSRDSDNGVTRFFKNLFGDDDDEADRYSRVGMQSNSIVTVHAQSADEAERAADLLDDYGAINVNERASQYGNTGVSSDSDRTSAYSDTNRSNMGNSTDSDTTINRIEENLEVGKRTVESGGVRVRSRIVERPVEESIRLREERVTVERNPVDRVADRSELANFEERDIELTERAEVPVVNKEARVVEEIRLNKDVQEREETIRDTVRSTEVDVENLSGNNTRGTTGRLDTDLDSDDTRNRNSRLD